MHDAKLVKLLIFRIIRVERDLVFQQGNFFPMQLEQPLNFRDDLGVSLFCKANRCGVQNEDSATLRQMFLATQTYRKLASKVILPGTPAAPEVVGVACGTCGALKNALIA